MSGNVAPSRYDNIDWFINEWDGAHNWDKKTAYGFLIKRWNEYKKGKTGDKNLIPIIREHIEKNNPDLLEWFDGLMVLV